MKKILIILLLLIYQLSSYANSDLTGNGLSYLHLILISLAGGFLLNFMPCVLPVLALKVNSLISMSRENTRLSSFFVSLGVVSAFLVIAIFIIFLKLSGEYAGLGINFQNPYFITALVILMMVFAIYISENYSLPLPQNFIEKLDKNSSHKALLGSFLSGILATILATPCTAPLLGSAISVAISGSVYSIILVFFFLGIGMSGPFLLVTINPSLIKYIPKSGSWNKWFKKILEILIYLSVLWLLYILSALLDKNAALLLFMICILFKFFLSNTKLNKLVKAISLITIISLAFFLPSKYEQNEVVRDKKINRVWKDFSFQEIDEALAEDKIVFIDISADWCLTCKYNKFTVLDNEYVMNYMQDHDIVTIRGDYTRESKEINKFLSMHNHYAIPLNVIYSKKYPNGIKLDPILTVSKVISALNRAK